MKKTDDLLQYEKRKDQQSKYRYIKKTARKIINKLPNINLPIEINAIVSLLSSQSKTKIFVQKLDLGQDCSGFISINNKVVGIGYNRNHNVVRQRFTVAHELGHWILGHKIKNGNKEKIYLKNTSETESEANIFAAELLIPKNILMIKVKNHLNIDELTKKFWVSKDAMWFKIYNDNLDKKLTL